ncbi:MAG: hypothetical protein AB7J46_06355 [Candidatus Altimarinota bacterium]
MEITYPRIITWYKNQTKPLYFQRHQPDIPASNPFPFTEIQEAFNTRYFTCSAAWLLAFAILGGFTHIELWGIEVAKRKAAYAWERPCLFYWIEEARRRGITVWYPDWLDWDFTEAGDPTAYEGKLYGLETKPEPEGLNYDGGLRLWLHLKSSSVQMGMIHSSLGVILLERAKRV